MLERITTHLSPDQLTKLVSSSLAQVVLSNQALLGVPALRFEYHEPTAKVTNIAQTDGRCPPDSPFAVVNAPGLGNNMIGEYASINTELIMRNKKNGEKICYIGFNPGTNLDTEKNTDVIHETIEHNGIHRVIIFAHSFGLVMMMDVLARYKEKYPLDQTEFAVVAFSSPGDADDLQPIPKYTNDTIAQLPPRLVPIRLMTYATMLSQGDTWQHPDKLWVNGDEAAKNTPATLVVPETVRLIWGLNEAPASLDNVPISLVTDPRDMVVDSQKSRETIARRLGRQINVVEMNHTHDPTARMGYHADLWWFPNIEDFEEVVPDVIKSSNEQLDRLAYAKQLAAAAIQGRFRLSIR